MSTETATERADHIRGLSVTTLAALAGIASAFLSAIIATGPQDTAGVYPLAAAVFLQYPLLRATGIVEEFSTKDSLFVLFVSFAFWFITWAVLLTTDTVIAL